MAGALGVCQPAPQSVETLIVPPGFITCMHAATISLPLAEQVTELRTSEKLVPVQVLPEFVDTNIWVNVPSPPTIPLPATSTWKSAEQATARQLIRESFEICAMFQVTPELVET